MICYVTVQTEDLKASIEFYQWLLDLPVTRRFIIPDGEIAFMGANETKLELIYSKEFKTSAEVEGISIGFTVDSLEEKMEMLKSKNISTTPIYSPNPNSSFFYFTDLNGIKIQLSKSV
jgi:lactoylglutathione lyase